MFTKLVYSAMSHYSTIGPTATAIALPFAGGILSGYVSSLGGSYGEWYNSLRKPDWVPPRPACPYVWVHLYGCMGVASCWVWKEGGGFTGRAMVPLALYGTQLVLNFSWPLVFFGTRSIRGAFINIVLLDAAALATTREFYKLVPKAGQLMIPYLGWLLICTVLNYTIWRDNCPRATE